MSISSMSSSTVIPGRSRAAANGYRFTTTSSNGAIAAAMIWRRWSARRRSARRPPWTRGWSVFTRPSSISGKPVTAATSVTGRSASRRVLAVPPVETSSNPRATSPRPKSVRPVLSDTDRSARRGRGTAASARSRSRVTCRPSGATERAPARSRPTDRGRSRCSTARMRAWSASASSPGRTATASCATMGPPSRVSSTKWIVQPVTVAPWSSASRTECAPGNAGSSDGCVFRMRSRNAARTRCPTIRMYPARTTTSTRAAASASASAASSPPGTIAVSMPCSVAQSRAGQA